MIVVGFDIEIRWPVWVRRVRSFWCSHCRAYRSDPARGFCRSCGTPLKRVQP